MSRLFVLLNDDRLLNSSPVLTAAPLSFSCWFYSDSATANQTLMGLFDSGSTVNFFRINAAGSVAGDPVRFQVATSLGTTTATTTTGYSVNTWTHASCSISSLGTMSVYINGGSKGTNTGLAPASIDNTAIGISWLTTGILPMSGRIGECAIYNIDLTDADHLMLSKNNRPPSVRPANLVSYWNVYGRHSPEIDTWGGFNMTVTGAVQADHPRMHVPLINSGRFRAAAAAAAGARRIVNGGLVEHPMFGGLVA